MRTYSRQERVSGLLLRSLLFAGLCLLLLSPAIGNCQGQSVIEAEITGFVRQLYGNGQDIQIKIGTIPGYAKDRVRVKRVGFAKVPDGNGDGLCIAEIEEKNGREKNLYVPFKVSAKKKLFVTKTSLKKGDLVDRSDVTVTETYYSGTGVMYPSTEQDIIGKRLKRDAASGAIITNEILEDSVMVKRGELVSIVAENKNLVLQAKGKTLEKGRVGDAVKVKNVTSGREVTGRITGQNTVSVTF